MEYFRGNSDRVTQKLFAEYQAKRYAVDVVDGSNDRGNDWVDYFQKNFIQ
ncbi:MAG: hypothetical protein ACXWYD_21425 [Candidatus Binatia bacterium]